MSFEMLLDKYDKEDTFFYLDPPYYDYESYYAGGFSKAQHTLLRDKLAKIKWKFLLSYNDTPAIRELYKDFKITTSKEIAYTLGGAAKNRRKVVHELYISNY